LYNGAQPRIPADPLKRRNTSIALEELRQGLVSIKGQNPNGSETVPTAIDTVGNTTVIGHSPDFEMAKAE
jgi:hypothetical protein